MSHASAAPTPPSLVPQQHFAFLTTCGPTATGRRVEGPREGACVGERKSGRRNSARGGGGGGGSGGGGSGGSGGGGGGGGGGGAALEQKDINGRD
ncbi:hypothetical protein FI667_g2408, partial [Globisporangium splendens]